MTLPPAPLFSRCPQSRAAPEALVAAILDDPETPVFLPSRSPPLSVTGSNSSWFSLRQRFPVHFRHNAALEGGQPPAPTGGFESGGCWTIDPAQLEAEVQPRLSAGRSCRCVPKVIFRHLQAGVAASRASTELCAATTAVLRHRWRCTRPYYAAKARRGVSTREING